MGDKKTFLVKHELIHATRKSTERATSNSCWVFFIFISIESHIRKLLIPAARYPDFSLNRSKRSLINDWAIDKTKTKHWQHSWQARNLLILLLECTPPCVPIRSVPQLETHGNRSDYSEYKFYCFWSELMLITLNRHWILFIFKTIRLRSNKQRCKQTVKQAINDTISVNDTTMIRYTRYVIQENQIWQ